jgi:hypothetical protein
MTKVDTFIPKNFTDGQTQNPYNMNIQGGQEDIRWLF